jgi:hypothetical protein
MVSKNWILSLSPVCDRIVVFTKSHAEQTYGAIIEKDVGDGT